MNTEHFRFWKKHHNCAHHFPMSAAIWQDSMYRDTDSEGRTLFQELYTEFYSEGLIQYGRTAFGFNENGEISTDIHHQVIRDICFDESHPEHGIILLQKVIDHFGTESRIYAFFHYFGMSACARHGKLHESQKHIHDLLLRNGFIVEHENIYYSKNLISSPAESGVTLHWRDKSPGSCREFAAVIDANEVCWGQVHFLPQGNIAYLRWIYVSDACQHRGIGTVVMHALFADLYKAGITRFDTDTALTNLTARSFYEKCGFTNEGITRSYYTP